MRRKICLFIFFLSLAFILFLIPTDTHASLTLFYDDFNNGHDEIWEEYLGPGGSWNIVNGEYIGTVSQNSYGAATYAIAGDVNWDDYILDLKVKSVSGIDKVIKFRYKNSSEFYAINLRSDSNDLVVGKTGYGFIGYETVENPPGVWHQIKIVLNGINIKIYINGDLKFDYNDVNNPILNGEIRLEVWPGQAAAQTIVAFDDVRVTSIDSEPSFLPVPYFSQRDPLWKADEYDHASKWVKPGQENTIDWWGCALTSGVMVARYFGIDKTPYGDTLTPGTLNKWMKDQNDANLRNGAMNWQLLSRMSKKTADLFNTYKLDLSLSKVAGNFPKLDEILTTSVDSFLGLPGILEVVHPISPNGKHFLVAKGRSGVTFGINDPYDDPQNPARQLLSISPYNDSFNKLLWYESTHSDLSTIFLVVEQNINISMIDPNIQPTGEQFALYPLGADGGEGESGEILKMLYLDKPASGNYAIGLATTDPQPQSYRLDIYLYDQDAEVKIVTLVGWVGPGDQDNIFINFDLENVQNSRITREVYFNTLRDDINLSYLFGWIDNQGIQTSLLAKVDAAERASRKEDGKNISGILNALLKEIEAQNGNNINSLSHQLLEGDITAILSQL